MSLSVQSHTPERGASSEDTLRKQRLLHDMRQSLTVVMSLAAVVDRSLDRGPEVLKRLEQMRAEVAWMTRLVSGAAPRAADTQVLDVGDVVSEAWCSAAATCGCAVQLVRDARAWVSVDRDDLERAVRNLLDNAVRAAGDEGVVVVHVRVEPEDVAVVVCDSGPGFGKIPTQQGLGLVTVRRFAAAHAGRLDVGRSLLGGAEMVLRLPRVPAGVRPSDGGRRCG